MNRNTKIATIVGLFSATILAVSDITKIYYEHTHIQQDEITVNTQTVSDVLNKEIIEHKKINGNILTHNFVCIKRGNRILPEKYTVTYDDNNQIVNYSLPNPDMIKKVSIDGLIHNHILPYDNTIINSSYHITPIVDNQCNVSYDVKWQNTNYNKNLWFYWIW